MTEILESHSPIQQAVRESSLPLFLHQRPSLVNMQQVVVLAAVAQALALALAADLVNTGQALAVALVVAQALAPGPDLVNTEQALAVVAAVAQAVALAPPVSNIFQTAPCV